MSNMGKEIPRKLNKKWGLGSSFWGGTTNILNFFYSVKCTFFDYFEKKCLTDFCFCTKTIVCNQAY